MDNTQKLFRSNREPRYMGPTQLIAFPREPYQTTMSPRYLDEVLFTMTNLPNLPQRHPSRGKGQSYLPSLQLRPGTPAHLVLDSN